MFVVPVEHFDEQLIQSVFKWSVCKRELSDDGFDHMQCVGVLNNSFRASAIQEKIPHAQCVEAKSLNGALDYVCKSDTATDVPLIVGDIPQKYKNVVEGKRVFGLTAMMNEAIIAPDYNTAIQTCKKLNYGEYIKNKKGIQSELAEVFTPTLKPQPITNFNIQLVNKITFHGRQQSVLLIGPSGVGKTQLAMAMFKNPLVVTCKQDFGKLCASHDGIVIDDLPWSNHAPETVLRLLNTEIPQSIDIKYGCAFIPPGTRKIFTLNSAEQFWPREMIAVVEEAIRSRINIIEVHNNAFIDNIGYMPL